MCKLVWRYWRWKSKYTVEAHIEWPFTIPPAIPPHLHMHWACANIFVCVRRFSLLRRPRTEKRRLFAQHQTGKLRQLNKHEAFRRRGVICSCVTDMVSARQHLRGSFRPTPPWSSSRRIEAISFSRMRALWLNSCPIGQAVHSFSHARDNLFDCCSENVTC